MFPSNNSLNQNCANCDDSLKTGWFSGPRFCNYSGKYFCSKCHLNKKYFIPAKILNHWDFKFYPISTFYLDFLIEMYHEPLFDIISINSNLLNISPKLLKAHIIRKQLSFMKDFIVTCREKEKLLSYIHEDQMYLTDTSFYSLDDLVSIEKGDFVESLAEVAELWLKHIISCELCKAKGSICEYCKGKDIIYPFLKNTVQCTNCKSISHRKCYNVDNCPKCLRQKHRDATITNNKHKTH